METETIHSDYGDVSVDANARTIRLCTTTGSGNALSLCALCNASPGEDLATGHHLTVIFLTNRGLGDAKKYGHGGRFTRAHFQRPSDVTWQDIDRMLARTDVPVGCVPAVKYFYILANEIAAAKRWCCATLVVKMSVSRSALRTDLAIQMVRYGEAAASAVREEACGICFEEFVEDVEVGRMQCSHAYHYKCLRQWLDRKRSCPYCRQPVRRNYV